jgi:hypothetical protein
MSGGGMPVGHHVNYRDAKGWRVPRYGTFARRVYVLMLGNYTAKEISRQLGVTHVRAAHACFCIRNSDKANRWRDLYPRKRS